MESFIRISVLDNEIQARYLEAVLQDRGIPHRMRSYHDAAYDGVFQHQKGWGHIEAPSEYRAEIIEIMKEIDEAPASDMES